MSNTNRINAKKRKSGYNADRSCYLTQDGQRYIYKYWDDNLKCMREKTLVVGVDISQDLAMVLDELDHAIDLNDRYQSELRDPRFDTMVSDYNSDNKDAVNPWDTIIDRTGNPEEALLARSEPEKPQVVIIRRIITEECTIEQQNLFYDHFGMGTSLEAIRQTEVAKTGKPLSHNAIPNRKNKIIAKSAKALGVERNKRYKK